MQKKMCIRDSFEADAENEYITAYKKVHPVEILKGYAIDAMAPGYENYSDFSEWAFDDVKEKEYIERAFFADTEEEARQIILDYQEYLKTCLLYTSIRQEP